MLLKVGCLLSVKRRERRGLLKGLDGIKQGYNLLAAFVVSQGARRPSVGVGDIYVCALLNQELDGVNLVLVYRGVQGRGATAAEGRHIPIELGDLF